MTDWIKGTDRRLNCSHNILVCTDHLITKNQQHNSVELPWGVGHQYHTQQHPPGILCSNLSWNVFCSCNHRAQLL